jgi:hypothetical protein
MGESTTHGALKRLALENDTVLGILRTRQPYKDNVIIK